MNKKVMEHRSKVIHFDVPNSNHRVYKKESFKDDILTTHDVPLYLDTPDELHPPKEKQIGLTNLEFTDEGVIATSFVKISDKTKDIVKALEDGKLHVRTGGVGELTDNGDGTYTVKNYELKHAFLTDKPA